MQSSSERVKISKWVHSGPVAVRIVVEAVLLPECPQEPNLEPRTVRLLDETQRLADAGDLDALAKIGEVYMLRSA